jgi:hypothetical protein
MLELLKQIETTGLISPTEGSQISIADFLFLLRRVVLDQEDRIKFLEEQLVQTLTEQGKID